MGKQTLEGYIKTSDLSDEDKSKAIKALHRIRRTGEAEYMLESWGGVISSFCWDWSHEKYAFWFKIDNAVEKQNPNFCHYSYILHYRKINRNHSYYKNKLKTK